MLDVVGVDQRQAVDADELAGLVQQQAVEAGGRGDDGAARVDDREPVVGVGEQQLQVVGIVRVVPRGPRCHLPRLVCRTAGGALEGGAVSHSVG